MIDELKLILDQLKGVPSMTYWILGGFLFYKLTISLSMSGSVVYVIKMFCTLCEKIINKPLSYGKLFISRQTEYEFRDFIESLVSAGGYIHSSDIKELRKAWTEYKNKKIL